MSEETLEVTLKDCPFCGSNNISIRYEGQPARRYAYACTECMATTGAVSVGGTASGSVIKFNNPAAIFMWNRRAEKNP